MGMNADNEVYETLQLIGRGSFGQIRKVKQQVATNIKVRRVRDGTIMARKEIHFVRMSEQEKKQLTQEVNILSTLRHPNIVRYYHRTLDRREGLIYMYMEYCGCGDLSQVIRQCKSNRTQLPEHVIWSILGQITLALDRCHFGQSASQVPGDLLETVAFEGSIIDPAKPSSTILHRDIKPENSESLVN